MNLTIDASTVWQALESLAFVYTMLVVAFVVGRRASHKKDRLVELADSDGHKVKFVLRTDLSAEDQSRIIAAKAKELSLFQP